MKEGKGRGGKRRGWRGGEESGCSTSLPPRFDNPGYGPGRVPGIAISYLTVEK